MKNWAGNVIYGAKSIFSPRSLDELARFVRDSDHLRVIGTRHSFNTIADPGENGHLISLDNLDSTIRFSQPQATDPTVTVQGSITYAQLCPQLDDAGYALHNLASLPHISIAGACATATHGSGNRNANLATSVAAMKICDASGEMREISPETVGDRFHGMVVGLGAYGPVVELTLKLQPRFDCCQAVWLNLPLDAAVTCFDQIMSSAYSVSLFTDWRTPTINQVWSKRRIEDPSPNELFGAVRATKKMHPIANLPADSCTDQLDQPGPWYQRLPHFRADSTPSSGNELQTEYFIPREFAGQAIQAVYELREQIAPLIQISEIRTIAADHQWMSPCFNQDCAAIHFTWIKNIPSVTAILPVLQQKLAKFNAVPHWAKLFSAENLHLRSIYKNRLDQFRSQVSQMDARGKFSNDFLRRTLSVISC